MAVLEKAAIPVLPDQPKNPKDQLTIPMRIINNMSELKELSQQIHSSSHDRKHPDNRALIPQPKHPSLHTPHSPTRTNTHKRQPFNQPPHQPSTNSNKAPPSTP
jgi:hypothetical protein